MWRNSLGMYTVDAVFVPAWYNTNRQQFKPLVIRRIENEVTETKTTESVCGTGHEAESRVTQEDQQADASKTKQAQP